MTANDEGFQWQVGVWDRISDAYAREIDDRFTGVVEGCLKRAELQPGERVLDLGTGTGAVAVRAASIVGPGGAVTGVDISADMLALARLRVGDDVSLLEGRAEAIPADDGSFDAVIASLSLMYALDRVAAAGECARVLRPGGRFVAAVWAGPDRADIVRFQQAAGMFTPPPVPGVGPGALGDPSGLLVQLAEAGIEAEVQTETTSFSFDTFEHAWDVLAGVTTAGLDTGRREQAKQAVRDAMWPDAAVPRVFENDTHFIVGTRVRPTR